MDFSHGSDLGRAWLLTPSVPLWVSLRVLILVALWVLHGLILTFLHRLFLLHLLQCTIFCLVCFYLFPVFLFLFPLPMFPTDHLLSWLQIMFKLCSLVKLLHFSSVDSFHVGLPFLFFVNEVKRLIKIYLSLLHLPSPAPERRWWNLIHYYNNIFL